jgi:hypothetical protein
LAIKLFGFQISRGEKEIAPNISTPISPQMEDGSVNISTAGSYGFYVDLDGSYRSELDLITKYRTISNQPEVESAIDDIVNESVVHDNQSKAVSILLDDLNQPDKIKDMIREEFDNILKLLDFGNFGNEIFRRWYIDGRLYYNIVIDKEDTKAGIQSLLYIDPRRIRKIKNVIKKKDQNGVEVIDRIDEFYIYNEKILNNNTQQPQIVGNQVGGIKLSPDSVAFVTSGIYDPTKATVLSYLHKAIRPMNQLRFVEDAIVIYRLSRAPERRVFYIDVGNMPKMKAEQYLQNMMNKFRTKLIYDSTTGEVRDDRKHLSMLEDFWIPRHNDKNTEITTLPAGQNLGELEDVRYFQEKLYKALGVPISRLQSDSGFSLGRSSEITRDELKFMKFINKLRDRFSILFDELLSKQLALKGVCTLEEWAEFKQDIHYDFLKDNNFAELKEAELLQNRLSVLGMVDPFIGRYFSKRWIQKNVLRMEEEEIEEIENEMKKEMEENPELQGQMGMMPPDQGQPPPEQGAPEEQQSPPEQGQQGVDINNKVQELIGRQK